MSKTILAVDDDPMALDLIKAVLAAAGYAVLTAVNGKQGLDIAIKSKPALILLDIMMPEMDGYSTLSNLKANAATAKIPVIMVTAVGYELNKQLAQNQGASDYITKPIDIKDLRQKVKQYI